MKQRTDLYDKLSRIKWLRSYSSKFFLVAFISLTIPLLGTIALLAYRPGDTVPAIYILGIAFFLTSISAIITIIVMNKLLDPVKLLQQSLAEYIRDHKLPALPQHYSDEIGMLMKEMQSALVKLDFLVETKNDVIELISHDLRSPASSMLGLIEVLETTRTEDRELMDYCDKLKGLISKQLMLTNDILTSMKQEEKLMEVHKKRMYVQPLISSTVKTFETALQQKNLTVEIDAPSYLGINGDETQLREVISNLLHNAIKFSHRNGTITIKAETDQESVRISVADMGVGMESVNPDLLFKRFTKYSRLGTYGEASSGLGLFICKRIIEKHGGTIAVQSTGTNKGTTFTIQLPN